MDYVGERPGMGCEALNRPIQRHMLDNGQAPHRTSPSSAEAIALRGGQPGIKPEEDRQFHLPASAGHE